MTYGGDESCPEEFARFVRLHQVHSEAVHRGDDLVVKLKNNLQQSFHYKLEFHITNFLSVKFVISLLYFRNNND